MKKKNKGRKSLTAVGAVVAAGLTPGIVTGAPTSLPLSSDVEISAADAISINGETFDFDELFAMQQINIDPREVSEVYGPPVTIKEARQDSIRRAMDRQALVYGPPTVVYGPPTPNYFVGPDEFRSIAADSKHEATELATKILMDYCSEIPNANDEAPISLSESGDLVRDLKMDSQQLKDLQKEIEDRFAVQLSVDMLKRLGTLRRIATFIVEVAKPLED